MSRVSPLRLCSTAGLTLGVAAAGLAFAPAALASAPELVEPTAPESVVAGQEFEVTGADCNVTDPEYPVEVWLVTDAAGETVEPDEVFAATLAEDGTWSATLSFPAGTTGEQGVYAFCDDTYYEGPLAYPPVAVWVTAPATATPTPTATPTVAPTGKIRGASANTAGVASPDGGAATGDTASAGKKVVKILTGFKPHEVVTVTLHSAPQTVGTFTADASGTVRVEFTVPAGTPAGAHTLVYEGNMGTYFQETLTVAAASGTGDNLAYTGASVAMPLGLGAGALALGGGLVFMTRRRNAQAAEASQA
jgi:hypothetical protein